MFLQDTVNAPSPLKIGGPRTSDFIIKFTLDQAGVLGDTTPAFVTALDKLALPPDKLDAILCPIYLPTCLIRSNIGIWH